MQRGREEASPPGHRRPAFATMTEAHELSAEKLARLIPRWPGALVAQVWGSRARVKQLLRVKGRRVGNKVEHFFSAEISKNRLH